MLDCIYTELRQGHRLHRAAGDGGLLQVINAKGEVKHTVVCDLSDPDWQARAIDLLWHERKTWLEGFYAASAQLERPVAIA